MFKEFKQLDEGAKPGNLVVIPTDTKSLSSREKKKSLRAVNFIKEKRNGDIKGRMYADGT